MEKHPIESLMGVSMDNIKDMVDVNTVIGDPVQTQDGSTIIPISRVAFGFVAGRRRIRRQRRADGGLRYAVCGRGRRRGVDSSDGVSGLRQERRAPAERGQRFADGARGGADSAGAGKYQKDG